MVIPAVVVSNTCSYWPAKRDTSVDVPAFKYMIAKWTEKTLRRFFSNFWHGPVGEKKRWESLSEAYNRGQSNLHDINVVRLYSKVLTSSHTRYGVGTDETPLTATSPQQLFFWADSPYIHICFNLSTMATFFCPQGDHCREVQLYFSEHCRANWEKELNITFQNITTSHDRRD